MRCCDAPAVARAASRRRLASDPVARLPASRVVDRRGFARRIRTEWERVLAAGNDAPADVPARECARAPAAQSVSRAPGESRNRRSGRIGEAALLLERPMPVDRAARLCRRRGLGAGRRRPARGAGTGSARGPARARCLRRAGRQSAHILESGRRRADRARPRCVALRATWQRNLAAAWAARPTCTPHDCCEPDSWWDGVAYDRILADVPCTASGVARRHPDIKWLRRESDIAGVRDHARHASSMRFGGSLTPGGKLLYATCSVFPEENDAVVDAFLERTRTARAACRSGRSRAVALLRMPSTTGSTLRC